MVLEDPQQAASRAVIRPLLSPVLVMGIIQNIGGGGEEAKIGYLPG